MKYLLDTSTCIDIIKKKSQAVFAKLKGLEVGEVGVSAITYAELEYGVANSNDPPKNRLALTEFLGPLEIMDFPSQVAPLYGILRASLVRSGKIIGPFVLLIASHAIYLRAILVTSNIKEFSRVPELQIDNWV